MGSSDLWKSWGEHQKHSTALIKKKEEKVWDDSKTCWSGIKNNKKQNKKKQQR